MELVQVETTNYCNAKCIFCPYQRVKEHGLMSDEVYNKILVYAHNLKPTLFVPLLTGEPFTDTKFMSRIRLARETLPESYTHSE